jgi:hypothetical protein
VSNSKISALTSATTPLAGTETLPIVQSGATVKATVLNVQVAPVSSGTANAVQYLNASKVPTTSSAFTFDGTNATVSAATASLRTADPATGYTYFRSANTNGNFYFGLDSAAAGFFGTANARAIYADGNYPVIIYSNATARITVAGTGDVTVNTGNLVQGTAAKGINFTANTPAAGMTSQLLNWYEEGTWTPNQGAGLTVVGTFASVGRYIKIGKQVTIQAYMTATSFTASPAAVVTSNLPFAANSASYGVGSLFNGNNTATYSVYAASSSIYFNGTLGATNGLYFSCTYFSN